MTLSAKLQDLQAQEHSYEASDVTKAKLSGKVVAALIAPTAVGKSTLAKRILELGGSDFSESYSVVTRPRRVDDPKEYKTRDEGYDIDRVLEMIQARELTHYVVHPSGTLYASSPDSFPAHYNILPLLPSILPEVQRAGFANVYPVYIVVSSQQWIERLAERRSDPSYKARLEEAIESLEWALEHADELVFVENAANQLDETARTIIEVTRGHRDLPDTERGVALVRDMLAFAQTELERA
ncbi:MAG: hypothetical protein JWO61_150 [Candidatus Saccharibacteria bacterium]|nr:hypothetical protein [Candidatus Saccharibacteria bacterium]